MKTFTLFFMILGCASLAAGEVVQSFEKSCPDFFITDPQDQNKHLIPTIFVGDQYKQICQRWKNGYRYATLYDTVKRIPVYSAYKYYNSKNKIERPEDWKIEPQLDQEPKADNKEMAEFFEPVSQALDKDYSAAQYSRGHVFPHSYAVDQNTADASFTLTNAAPQTQDSNEAWAKYVEVPMLKEIKDKCKPTEINPAYIVTGVVPGKEWMAIERRGHDKPQGINIPTHYWTAYSCTNAGRSSKAYLALQGTLDKNTKFKSEDMTVAKLNDELTKLYNKPFTVFPVKNEKPTRSHSAPLK